MKEYFVFHKEWYELRKNMSKNAWYELEDLMMQLRWEGIDTDPKDVKNKTVRNAWISIRSKINDSIDNLKRKKKQNSVEHMNIQPQQETPVKQKEMGNNIDMDNWLAFREGALNKLSKIN